MQHWSRHHEGGVGNIIRTDSPDDPVQGPVHLREDQDLTRPDAVEAYGIGYDRIEVALQTEQGPLHARTYSGRPGYLDDTCLPSRRDLNSIVNGARAADLDAG